MGRKPKRKGSCEDCYEPLQLIDGILLCASCGWERDIDYSGKERRVTREEAMEELGKIYGDKKRVRTQSSSSKNKRKGY